MSKTITLIPGDGIGPEVTAATLEVLSAAGADFEWERVVAGSTALEQGHEDPLPREVLDSIERNRVALKGPVATPVGKGFASINVRIRKSLELYANLRPVRSLPGIPSRYEDVDLVVVRENTEGLYSGLEHEVVKGVVESLKIVTEKASLRIAEFAFEYAEKQERRRITAVHKANIMKMSDGLFLDCFRRVSEKYPAIEADDRIVDNMCMQLVLHPQKYDMVVMENLYGDIVSDLAAGLVGGLGVVPGANIGEGLAVFEAVHGSAPDIEGQDKANPLALIQTSVLMLRHLGEKDIARRIDAAVDTVLAAGTRTGDVGGTATTSEFTKALVDAIGRGE